MGETQRRFPEVIKELKMHHPEQTPGVCSRAIEEIMALRGEIESLEKREAALIDRLLLADGLADAVGAYSATNCAAPVEDCHYFDLEDDCEREDCPEWALCQALLAYRKNVVVPNSVIELMQHLRDAGWLVVLKAMPEECHHVIQGARSEYDAPCDDTKIGKGQWSCEASWMGKDFIHGPWALGDTPEETVQKVAVECVEAVAEMERRKAERDGACSKPNSECPDCDDRLGEECREND